MKPFFKVFFISITLMLFPTLSNGLDHVDGIAAIVNDDIVTQQEYQQAVAQTFAKAAHDNTPITNEATLKKQILEMLINQKMMAQMAKTAQITVASPEVDEAIQHIATNNHMTTAQLEGAIQAQGQSFSEFKKGIEKQILLQKVQSSVVRGRIHITPTEVSHYRAKLMQTTGDTQFHLKDLLIPAPNAATPSQWQETETRAQTIQKELKTATDFDKISDPSSSTLTDLDWRSTKDLPDLFASIAPQMKVGSIRGPIRADNGFHFILLVDKKTIGQVSLEEARAQLFQEKAQKELQTWLNQLRSTAYIKIY